jgi:hypothetical protein
MLCRNLRGKRIGMYCPRCSQQQISEDVSFCTRCGFQLGPVKELLAGGGTGQQIISQTEHSLRRRKKLRLGYKLIFFSLMLFPVFLALAIAVDEPGPLALPGLIFMAGLTWTLYSWLFVEETPAVPGPPTTVARVLGDSRGVQSPPLSVSPPTLAPGAFEELPAQRGRTAEIVQPPSVTERTTNLLKKTAD